MCLWVFVQEDGERQRGKVCKEMDQFLIQVNGCEVHRLKTHISSIFSKHV